MNELSRRRLLQALGLTAASGLVSLPSSVRASTTRPRRVIFVLSELGWVPSRFRMRPPGSPASLLEGSRYHPADGKIADTNRWQFSLKDVPRAEWSQGLAPLYDLRDYVTAIDGLGYLSIGADQYGDGHAKGFLASMTGNISAKDSPTRFDTTQKSQALRPSVDQLIKRHLRQADRSLTDLTSLELRLTSWYGGTDGNNFHNFLYDFEPGSDEQRTVRIPAQADFRVVYDRLFPGMGTGTNPVTAGQADVLRYIDQQFSAVRPKLSKADRQKLETHRALVDDLRRRTEALATLTCAKPARPQRLPGVPVWPPSKAAYEQNCDVMTDLITAAMSCDLTRVATVLLSYPPYDVVGLDESHDAHHWYSHGSTAQNEWYGVPNSGVTQAAYDEFVDARDGHTKKMVHHMSLVAKLAQKLKATPDGEGNLLDNTLIVFTDEISHGGHGHDQVPVVLIGGGGGAVRPGRYIRLPRDNPNPGIAGMGWYVGQPYSHLLVSVCQMMGLPLDDLGLRAVEGRVPSGPMAGTVKQISLTGGLRELL